MKRKILIAATAAFSALIMAGAALAANSKSLVDAAKAQGVVGEQADGFLGLVKPDVAPEVKAAVQDINLGRAALYRETAQKNGVSVEAAGAATFNQVVQSKLKPGEFYRPAGGGWTKK